MFMKIKKAEKKFFVIPEVLKKLNKNEEKEYIFKVGNFVKKILQRRTIVFVRKCHLR